LKEITAVVRREREAEVKSALADAGF